MSEQQPLTRLADTWQWCEECGVVAPERLILAHQLHCSRPIPKRTDRLSVVRWRRERKLDGWYAEDVDWLVGEVERLRSDLATAIGGFESAQRSEVEARTLLVNIRTQIDHFFNTD
jgi:hypothetical protein